MHTKWRALTGQWLLGAALCLAVLIAIGQGVGQGYSGWSMRASWLLAMLVGAGLFASATHHYRTERFRRRLALGLTHQLRTSLAHIRMYNEMLLLDRAESEAERVEWLEIVGREAEQLGTAVENVLIILSEPKDKIPALHRSVDLGEMLEDVVSATAGPVGAAVTFEGGPPSGVLVSADPAELKHALVNLLDGLGRRSPGVALSATLTTSGEVATIHIGVGGNGAPPRTSLWRSRGSDPAPDACAGIGFGLELAVAEQIARAHGGRLSPFHVVGRSGYRLELPLVAG